MNATAEMVADGLADLLRREIGPGADVKVYVAPDPATGLELLAAGRPGGFSVVVFYDGDAPNDQNTSDFDTVVDATLTVGVAGHPGLSANDSRRSPGALAFAGRVRAIVCAAEPEGLVRGYDYMGMRQVRATDGSLMRGYALTFGATYPFGLAEDAEPEGAVG